MPFIHSIHWVEVEVSLSWLNLIWIRTSPSFTDPILFCREGDPGVLSLVMAGALGPSTGNVMLLCELIGLKLCNTGDPLSLRLWKTRRCKS